MQIRWQRLVWQLACVLALMFVATATPAADEELDDYELMQLFVDTFEQIERNYVKDVDRRKLMESAIRGMISDLDRYSSYISPEDLAGFNQMVEQQFGGIGIHVTKLGKTKPLTVMSPLPGTPAYRGGILAGDVITKIEDESTEGFGIDDAVKRLKGKPGEAVNITVRHLDTGEEEEINLVRAIIKVPTVLGDSYDDDGNWNFIVDDEHKIAYVRLTHFSRRSAEELRVAVEQLTAKGMKGLVLDLRTNPGGLLSQATAVADLFIDEGKIVSTKGRNTPERVWEATTDGTFEEFPMAVLVNRYSASASEIVSACLQDNKRAVIVGERTWGKGSVQNVIELEEGSSALKLTTASYHRPSGKNIHKFPGAKDDDEWGVMPDEEFKLPLKREEQFALMKYRRDRDVLRKGGPPKSDFKDRQLGLALEHIVKELSGSDAAAKDTAPEDKKKSATNSDDKEKNDKAATVPARRRPKPVALAA